MMSDLEFVGGNLGVYVGNQQYVVSLMHRLIPNPTEFRFTVRNAKFSNNKIAIQAVWNW